MNRRAQIGYLLVIVGLAVAGFFLEVLPWWGLILIGVIAMLPVVVADWVVSARRKKRSVIQPDESCRRPISH
ncbi:hypothetical protein [Plantactinospora soyae]|uniref:Membrane protein YdbS with pleckstrin-like domain n=1 Tax=Plantactinospora soyae TaxID=1544732 RepID=A0A927MB48_9ACTN|nr:hypothetical protein [Plantactinospora soyae]MBE1489926.1 membrane protein YdbS with pleckstrin-like domain [Plantactinospora soyae]